MDGLDETREDVLINDIWYTDLTLIGQGEEGNVYCGRDRSNPKAENVAIKFPLDGDKIHEGELQVLQKVQANPHLNIISVKYASESHLITELCQGGDLEHFVQSNEWTGVAVTTVLSYVEQLRLMLTYLQENHILHGDIQSRNICFQDQDHHSMKLIDFGNARSLDRRSRSTTLATKDDIWMGELVYRLVYGEPISREIAPENYFPQSVRSSEQLKLWIQQLLGFASKSATAVASMNTVTKQSIREHISPDIDDATLEYMYANFPTFDSATTYQLNAALDQIYRDPIWIDIPTTHEIFDLIWHQGLNDDRTTE